MKFATFCFAFVFLFNIVNCSEVTIDSNDDIFFVQNLTEYYLQKQPGFEIVYPVIKETSNEGPSIKYLVEFKLGGRRDGSIIFI